MHHIIPNCIAISYSNLLKAHMAWMWPSELRTKGTWELHKLCSNQHIHIHTQFLCLHVCMHVCTLHTQTNLHHSTVVTDNRMKSVEWCTNSRDNSLDTLASDYNLYFHLVPNQCLKPYINPAQTLTPMQWPPQKCHSMYSPFNAVPSCGVTHSTSRTTCTLQSQLLLHVRHPLHILTG